MRNTLLATALIAFAIASPSCAKKGGSDQPIVSSAMNTQKLLAESKQSAYDAIKAGNNPDIRDAAERGIEFANSCLMISPEEAGCYYWRAVNTGLYLRTKILGYQDKVKQMIADLNRVAEIDQKYDHAGAYRILGQIYTQLPETTTHVDNVTRDLDLAMTYLKKSVEIAPDYPENYIALAQTLIKTDKVDDAAKEILSAQELVPQWKGDISYDDWKKDMASVQKQIKKKRKLKKTRGE
jgi:tetratricopeptide (TPR) repeat protein